MSKRRPVTVDFFLDHARSSRPCASSDLQFGPRSTIAGADPLATVMDELTVRRNPEGLVEQLREPRFGFWACDVLLVRSNNGGDIELHWGRDLDDDDRAAQPADESSDPRGSASGQWKYVPYVPPSHCILTRSQFRHILQDWITFMANREPFRKTYDATRGSAA